MLGNERHHPLDFFIIEKRGRAAAEMQLAHRRIARDFALNQFNFPS